MSEGSWGDQFLGSISQRTLRRQAREQLRHEQHQKKIERPTSSDTGVEAEPELTMANEDETYDDITTEIQPTHTRSSGMIRGPLSKFNAKKSEDPDTHVAEFESVCQANIIYSELERKNLFPCTLKGVAMDWYVQFEREYFDTWAKLKDTFLGRFRTDKTPVQLLQKLYTLKQSKGESIMEYS